MAASQPARPAEATQPTANLTVPPCPRLQRHWRCDLEFGRHNNYLTFVLLLERGSMAQAENLVTTVSTKGQVILPKVIRQRREWDAGTRLIVEETPDGVLLKRAPTFAATRPNEVFGRLPSSGEPKSLEDMEAGVLAEARRRHDRD